VNKIKNFLFFIRHYIKILLNFVLHISHSKIIIVATPTHGNLGDQAITYAEKSILKSLCPQKPVIEVENGGFIKCKKLLKRLVNVNDVIVIDGGGNLGTLWPWEDDKISDIIDTFKDNKIIVFPQTMYYDNTNSAIDRIEKNKCVYSKAKDLTFLFRDRASYLFFNEKFSDINAFLCPDIVLSLNKQQLQLRQDVLLCFRTDREKVISDDELGQIEQHLLNNNIKYSYTDTVIKKSVRAINRKIELYKKWREFSCCKLVITDRLHAMIFAYITNTPCIAINNKSKKVEGSFDFIKNCNYVKLADNLLEVLDLIPMLVNLEKINKGDFVYPIDIIKDCLNNGK